MVKYVLYNTQNPSVKPYSDAVMWYTVMQLLMQLAHIFDNFIDLICDKYLDGYCIKG